MKASRKRRGMVNIWVALMGMMIIGLVGLACDAAFLFMTAHELQNAADAASLAAAAQIRNGETAVRQAGVDIALANEAALQGVQLDWNGDNLPEGDIVMGRWDADTKTFEPTESGANAVRVVARRTTGSLGGPMPTIFGRVFGVATVDVFRSAIATNQGQIGAGILVLCDDCPCAFEMRGSVSMEMEVAEGVTVEGALAVHVNSTDPCAACGNGSSLNLVSDQLNVVGDACWTGSPTLPESVNTGVDPIPDPLLPLPDPPYDPLADLGTINTDGNFGPGYYSGGIDLNSNNVTLEPGIYILDGAGLQVRGSTNMIAEGVLFYVIGTGFVDLAGNGYLSMSPIMDDLSPFKGVTVFQARDNTNASRIIGSSDMDLEGTFYFPAAHLEIGGSGASLGNQIVAHTLELHGSGTFDLAYNGNFPIDSNRVFIVE